MSHRANEAGSTKPPIANDNTGQVRTYVRTYVRHAFTFVECLAKVSVSGIVLMQAARNQCTRPMQLSRHIVEADSHEGGKGKRHEARHGALLIARYTHIRRRRCSTRGYSADSFTYFYFIETSFVIYRQ